ncbi:MAG: ATP-binding cassette domain-containing protein [Alphaproteobacteria bacterium]|nr:ATP-binding cassette domain-containing protein [Alphaproteobacteria bacterium]
MQAKIEVDGLVRRFGPLTAVDDVTFQVTQGEVLGFLGPNGAGKSTTMKMITGYLTPSAGQVRVCGFDVVQEPLSAKALIGYLPEGAPAYPDMTPASFLAFCARTRGLAAETARQRIAQAVDTVAIGDVLEQSIDTLSKGYKRRVGLAQAILHDPPVLILDEPTDGLDPNQKHEVRTLIANMATEKAIIISTHILEEVDAVCTRAMIIDKGRMVADGTPEMLQARSPGHNAVVVRTSADGAEAALFELADVARVETLAAGTYRIYPRAGRQPLAAVAELARRRGWSIDHLAVEAGRLDEVFRQITGGGRRHAA